MRTRAVPSATVLGVAVLGVAALAALPTRAAHADSDVGVQLPLTGYYQMAVDSRHGHLFFSQGDISQNSILVTDFAGHTVAKIDHQIGVMGITLSPDGATLYAALDGAHEITAISTATLKQTAAYPLGDAVTPYYLAVQSGKLWVSFDSSTPFASAIGDLNLSAPHPTLEMQAATTGWFAPPLIAADPADISHTLVAVQPGSTATAVASYDTAPDPVQDRAGGSSLHHLDDVQNCELPSDVAVLPGGDQFVPGCGAPGEGVSRYSTADLTSQGTYNPIITPGAYPAPITTANSVAFAEETGLTAIGVWTSSISGSPNVYLYAPGDDTPLDTLTVEDPDFAIADAGLGLTADGSKLFAVGGDVSGAPYTLYTYNLPAQQRSTLTLTGAASAAIGHSLTLHGSLTAGQSPAADGAAIQVVRTGQHTSTTLSATTGPNGAFTLTDTPPAAGSYTYTASYTGTASIAPAWAAAAVTVTKPAPALTMTVTPTAAIYRPVVHITVHLGPTSSNRTVSVYAKPAGSKGQILVKSGPVNGAGSLTAGYPAAHTTTFSAVFAGDSTDSAKTATAVVHVSASVSAKLSGYYTSKVAGTVTYRLYHRTRLDAAISVAPAKPGECVKLEVQEYGHGSWQPHVFTGCQALGAHSTASGHLALSSASLGGHYRIRFDYRPGSDPGNASADSTWQYFAVEK